MAKLKNKDIAKYNGIGNILNRIGKCDIDCVSCKLENNLKCVKEAPIA